jgi:hypothetical protein
MTKTGNTPWLVPGATQFLEEILTPESRVFEWGMGGSTPWLAERCGELWSVEHDEKWFWRVAAQVGREPRLIWSPPEGNDQGDPSDPDGCWSSCVKGSFRWYVDAISQAKDYDLVLVDGRARASCVKAGAEALRPGGWLVVDNTERDWYLRRAGEHLAGWQCVAFKGPGWQTSFWRKPGGEGCDGRS